MPLGSVATGAITIKNDGSLPATMSLSVQNVSATSALDTYLNMTIEDRSTGIYCIYGQAASGGDAGTGACDVLTNMTTVDSTHYGFKNIATLVLPSGTSGTFTPGGRWAPAESHAYIVYVELCGSGGSVSCSSPATTPVTGPNASLDLVWTAVQ
jgi:hypothetical protein